MGERCPSIHKRTGTVISIRGVGSGLREFAQRALCETALNSVRGLNDPESPFVLT